MNAKNLLKTSLVVGVIALALGTKTTVQAETVLIDFGNNSSFRGASQNGTDSNGYYWNSIWSGAYYGSLVDISNSATTLGIGFSASTGLATDSYNGPSGATSAPITQPQIDAANIDSVALGILGGSKASAFDFYQATDGRFVIQNLNVNETYNLTFFGSHKFNAVNTTDYGVYTDGNYTTSVGSTSLNVGVNANNNTNTTATIAGVTPQTSNTLYVRFGASGYTAAGYINEMSIVGYVPYNNGGTVTLSAAKSYAGNTILSNSTAVNADATGALGSGAALQIDAGGGSLALGANQTVAALIGSGNLALATGANTLTISPNGSTTFNVLTGSNGNFGSNDYSGVLSGSGTISKTGSGTQILSGANTFSGTFKNSAGTLALNNVNALQNAKLDTLYGATGTLVFGVSGNNTYNLGGLFGNRAIDMGGNSLNVSTANGAAFYDGVLSGAGSLIKSGNNTFTLRGNNTFSGSVTVAAGTLQVADDGPVGGGSIGSTSGITNNGTLVYNLTTNNRTYSSVIGGTGVVNKLGANTTLTLAANNTYTGLTTVTAGTLILNGTNDTSGVSVSGNGTLGGSGKIAGAISGAGQVGPGNSPGILTATQVNPTGGLDFNFEFTATGAPTFSNPSASVNDVLHLNNGTTPFTADLTSANTISLYLNLAAVAANDVFQGGFFTDKSADFFASLSSANFAYYVKGDGGGLVTYNGVNYYTLAQYNPSFTMNMTTVLVPSAAFADGTVTNGYISQLTVVPEPSTWVLLAGGLTVITVFRRRHRN